MDKYDANLFFLDWSKGAKTLDYNLAKNRVYDVAKVLAEFYTFLNEEFGVDLKKITCIGFSLGGNGILDI